MDQLRKAFGWLKRQHFWVLTGLIALVALICWQKASGKLAKEFNDNKNKINSEFEAAKKLVGEPFHPNDDIIKKQQDEIHAQAKSVDSTWQQLHDRQKKNVLEWPTQLSKEFRDYVAKIKFGDDIPDHLRDNYLNYAKLHFESLPKIVHARALQPGEGGAGGAPSLGGRSMMMRGEFRGGERGGGLPPGVAAEATAEDQEDYICEWLDQQIVRDELDILQRPSAIRIWKIQEDLWVYHTLLQIIANTNDAAGADRMSNAAIRVIESLEVGKTAALSSRTPGRIELIQAAESSGGAGPGEREPGAMTEQPMMPGGGESAMPGGERDFAGPGGGGMSPEVEKTTLLSSRYIDKDGKPIAVAAEGQSSGGTIGVEPNAPYKRLPVRMVLEMDQRWIPQLICECANQPLQVEVTEVRINPSNVGGGGGGMGGAFEGLRGGSRGGGPGMSGSGGGGAGTFTIHTPGQVQSFSPNPNLVTVVIQGIVYIFREPDKAALQVGDQVATQ